MTRHRLSFLHNSYSARSVMNFKRGFTSHLLVRATLSGARVTEEQLKTAKSLKGATMRDGSIHP
jgi:hypothetical protein